ncbi:response regulator transcription factor [Flectobacillus major]|jgi:DNA-binding response OmpR family regulator|uniref:response regulator transcription factor n=1 Tax=Flectobacillus major TaxID=103 RepID=UPI00047D301B|nr:response regulator transcription factor [Flectobacillus major]
MKILVIEDNTELARNLQQFLSKEGIICEFCYTYQQAEDRLLSFDYDCVVLDIMLPDGNGLDILKLIKKNRLQSNILIISAKNSLDDKINGLELGADDYLTKPFHLSELLARLRAIYRRNVLGGDNIVVFNELTINTLTHEVKVHDTLLDLTKKEFDLLVYFLANKNRVITRQSIAEHLWGDYTDNLANFDFVYQHVKNLRKKISASNGKDYIGTVYGLGYKFETNPK